MCRPCDGAALAVGALVQQAAQGRACATAAAAAAACWRECLKLWAAGRQNLAADDAPAAAAACLRLAAEAQSWQGGLDVGSGDAWFEGGDSDGGWRRHMRSSSACMDGRGGSRRGGHCLGGGRQQK
eukprot:1158128-Pelagomonas_calceolata.AAC.3